MALKMPEIRRLTKNKVGKHLCENEYCGEEK